MQIKLEMKDWIFLLLYSEMEQQESFFGDLFHCVRFQQASQSILIYWEAFWGLDGSFVDLFGLIKSAKYLLTSNYLINWKTKLIFLKESKVST